MPFEGSDQYQRGLTGETLSKNFKTELIYLIPIIVSLLSSVGCAYLLMASGIELFNVTPFHEENPVGPVGNALYFVILVSLGALILFFLLKKRSYKLI
ncbi:MAG: hypothetical protein QW791_01050, partial [Candidatus Bathyarchaeia archaeon]